jgi:hypothetical protein
MGKGDVVEILLRNGANINEKNVRNILVGETDDFEKERESKEREQREWEQRKGAEKGSREREPRERAERGR